MNDITKCELILQDFLNGWIFCWIVWVYEELY